MTSSFRSTAVVGAGAVGSFFGAMLARAGHPVTLIGRPAHVQAIERDGPAPRDGRPRSRPCRIAARTELAAVRGADLVLFCVKSTDTEAVARAMAPHLAAGALVLSLQNGVENAATIARHVRQPVVPAVVYVATAMPEPGVVKHHGRGDLVIGAIDAAGARGRRRSRRDCRRWSSCSRPPGAGAHLGRRDGRAVVQADGELRLQRDLRPRADALRPAGGAAPRSASCSEAVVREVVAVAAADGVDLPLERRARGDGAHRRARCRRSSRRPRRTWRAASRARSTISTASSPGAAASSASRRRPTRPCMRW